MPPCCGDTHPLCHVAHASVGLRRVSIAHIGGDKALVLGQEERAKASQASMRHAWSDRAYPGACVAVLASPACLAVPARHGVRLLAAPRKFETKCSAYSAVTWAASWFASKQFCLELRGYCSYTASSLGFFLGAPRSSVASGAGLEPGVPRGRHWRRTYEMDI